MITLVATLSLLGAPDVGQNRTDFFEKSIRPALVRYCYECHSSATEEPKGGLRLDSRGGVRRGGARGPALVPGKADESLLIAAIRRSDPALQMPPDRALPAQVVRDLERWIAIGAPDPRDAPPDAGSAAAAQWKAFYEERRAWWSFQPLAATSAPASGKSSDPIDEWIHAALEAKGLTTSPRADRATLVRRLSFALTGLPPDVGLLDSALNDESADWWGRLVDRLLASPHFGERWARHWMDVVRYSETYGYEWDIRAKGAWRYRDYLVRAFNADVPFDDFVREHIAGDLLESPRLDLEEGINESLIALMFYQMGEKRHDDTLVFNGIHQDMVDDIIDTFSKAFLGLTLSCSRCHDHKLDPLSQREYYALAGVFMSSRWVANTCDLPERNAAELEELREIKQVLRPLVADAWRRDLETFGEDLVVASSTSPASADREASGGDPEVPSRVERLQALVRLPDPSAEKNAGEAAEPALEDLFDPWRQLLVRARRGQAIADAWHELESVYTEAAERRRLENDEHLEIVADFREGIPPGWSVDGVGTRETVPCGDFVVSLKGERVVERVLEGGLFTNALSPRLNGAVRTPYLSGYATKPMMSFEQVGGEFAAHRTVFDNEFLTEHQKNLNPGSAGWLSLRTHHTLEDKKTYFEFATKTSNPNFPPRIGKCRECTREVVDDPRSWFGLTRVALHDEGFTPRDDLARFLPLFAGPTPATLEAAAGRYTAWLSEAVDTWRDGRATSSEVAVINELLGGSLLLPITGDDPDAEELRALTARYRQVETLVKTPWTANGMRDLDPGYDYPLDIRGDYDRPGDRIPRGFPRLLTGGTGRVPTTQSGRRELAELVADPANPLTARVYVNRVWYWLFGTGLVDTPSNFGHVGGRPSHPELLDALAARFLRDGWSTKKLVRAILMTQTWRRSGDPQDRATEVDPDNRLLSYFPLKRLEAEALRDALLASSGRLERRLYGESVYPYRENPGDRAEDVRLYSGPVDGEGRRSIYTHVSIMEPPAFLTAFNQPDPKLPTGRRDVTNTVAQSLALLNGPLVRSQAEFWAGELVGRRDASPAARIEHMFLKAFARRPTRPELDLWLAAVEDFSAGGSSGSARSTVMESLAVWNSVAHALYNAKEFVYVR